MLIYDGEIGVKQDGSDIEFNSDKAKVLYYSAFILQVFKHASSILRDLP